MISALSAFALLLSAQVAPAPRHFLGESAFSFEYAGDFKQVRSEAVENSDDWLVRVTEWELDGEDIYIAASMFEGKPGTKMDKPFLKKAIDEFVDGMESEKDPASMIANDAVTIDEQPAQKAAYRIGKGKESMFFHTVFLTSGENLYSLVAVYFEETGRSAEAAKRSSSRSGSKSRLTTTTSAASSGKRRPQKPRQIRAE